MLLLKQKISKYKLYALFFQCSNKMEYEYFFHTVKFLYIKLALKYLSLNMMDEAIYLATKTNIPEIQTYCMMYAKKNRDPVSISLLNQHKRKDDENPETPSRQASFI
jgi:hypothetical protein